MPSTAERSDDFDPTIYPVEDDVGEDLLQTLILEVLRPLIVALFAAREERALVGADQYIYWEKHNPRKVVAPDIYVLPGVDPRSRVKSWKVWDTGIVPSFALEVMGDDERKDVEESPERYSELGVKELIVFDPEPERRSEGVRFRVFRRVGKRGLVLVEATNEDRVRSKQLDAWLCAVGDGNEVRLRVGLGPTGDDLLPTEAELAQMESKRAETEAQRAQTEAQRGKALGIEMLRQMLTLRFGPLPKWVAARLEAASTTEIQALGKRTLEARTLREVFESRRR